MTKRENAHREICVPGHPNFDPLAKFGVSMEAWLALTQEERNFHHKRLRPKEQPKGKKFDPARYGLSSEEWNSLTKTERERYRTRIKYRLAFQKCPEQVRAKQREKRKRYLQRIRAYDLARYWANPEKRRKTARESYRRHHEKQLQRYRDRRAKQKSISIVRHNPNEVYHLVVAAIPGKLPRFARDDIAGMICLAVLEGKVLVKDIEKEVASFMRSYNREYDTFKTVSLDTPIPGMDGMTYLDKLAAGADDT